MIQADLNIILPEILLGLFAMLALVAVVYTGKDKMASMLTWLTAGVFATDNCTPAEQLIVEQLPESGAELTLGDTALVTFTVTEQFAGTDDASDGLDLFFTNVVHIYFSIYNFVSTFRIT